MKALQTHRLWFSTLTLVLAALQTTTFAADAKKPRNPETAGHIRIRDNDGYSIEQVVAEALGTCDCPDASADCTPRASEHQAPPSPEGADESWLPPADQQPSIMPTPDANVPQAPSMASVQEPGFGGSLNRVPGFIGDFFGTGTSTVTLGTGSISQRSMINQMLVGNSTTLNGSLSDPSLFGGKARLNVYYNGQSLPFDSSATFNTLNSAFHNSSDPNSFGYAIESNSSTTTIGVSLQNQLNSLQPGTTLSNGAVIGPNGANASVQYAGGAADFNPEESAPIPPGGRDLQTEQQPGDGGSVDNFIPSLAYTGAIDTLNSAPIVFEIPSPSAGGAGAATGRLKLAENASPLPRDRVFLNYSYFDGVKLQPGGVNVNRFSPGFEKTFFNRNASFELRIPMATTLNSTTSLDSSNPAGVMNLTNTNSVELGNLVMWFKALLYRTETFAASAGTGVSIPTADDVQVRLNDGFQTNQLIQIDNDAVHILPFVGAVYAPTSRAFYQGILQFDFDSNGNPVYLNNMTNSGFTGLTSAGRINDTSFVYLDLGAGYWFEQSDDPYDKGLTGVAGILELHYNAAMQGTDVVSNGQFAVGNYQDNIQIINAVIGTTLEFDFDKTATVAYVLPLEHGADRQFDGELRVFVNWFIGRRDRLTRPVF